MDRRQPPSDGTVFRLLAFARAILRGKVRSRLHARLIEFCDHLPSRESIQALRNYVIARGRLTSDQKDAKVKSAPASADSSLPARRKLKKAGG